MFVFVYGTLKRGYGNNHCLTGAYFVSNAVTTQKWRMHDAGFPVMRDRSHDHPEQNAFCTGEVWHFNDPAILQRLDRLESNGRMYHRRRIQVVLADGQTKMKVWAYIGDKHFWWMKGKRDLLPLQDDCYVWPPAHRRESYRAQA